MIYRTLPTHLCLDVVECTIPPHLTITDYRRLRASKEQS